MKKLIIQMSLRDNVDGFCRYMVIVIIQQSALVDLSILDDVLRPEISNMH